MGKFGMTELILIFIILLLYFLPAYIASNRRAVDRTLIFVLNLLVGWTFIGWIAMLIWACVGRTEGEPVVLNITNSYPEYNTTPRYSREDDFGKKMENIQKLKELFDSGAITKEEFDNQKSRILS
ncbi:superinfection immunity protein [Flavobacterium sp. MFBS3-15]|uniref:superinfection immunity protein n=1 Tax=Flavobacterium sp. MFBS3-15 TaxID=2989816 RepID=UPI002235ACD3|nr:superinfection immunity protein [Flavobacterium sp. MFBS3-15]MCW4469714.1 superinfection immunity protein [Flavobacterium sp. MFBS3-15]